MTDTAGNPIPGYDAPLLPSPNYPGPTLFSIPEFSEGCAPPIIISPPISYEIGPGMSRRPAPGERCFVLCPLHTDDNFLYEILIHAGKVYSISVEKDEDDEHGFYTSVQWWPEGSDEKGVYEYVSQEDTFFWYQDAENESIKRIKEAPNGDGETK